MDYHGGDRAVIGALGESEEQALAEPTPDEALRELRAGKTYRMSSRKNETVSIFMPVRNFKGDVALYLRHDFETNFYKKVAKSIWTSVVICVVGLLLSSLVIWVLYREITIPISELVVETEKIKRFELDEPVTVAAKLKEIQKLVVAITGMKTGLSSFKKYVPAQLVRSSSHAPGGGIGGQRRELTICSRTSPTSPPSPRACARGAAAQLSEYLDATTRAIMEERGTVDKFIGDAVMAFWGAPQRPADHALAACRRRSWPRPHRGAEPGLGREGKPACIPAWDQYRRSHRRQRGFRRPLNYTVIGDR